MKNNKISEALKKYWKDHGYRQTYKRSPEHKEKMRVIKTGQTHTEQTCVKISRNHADVSGKNNPMYGKRGNLHPAWKGGISKENDILRKGLEARVWRVAVFTRDDYTCQACGDRKSGKLNADHIKPWSTHPDLRYAIDNGRTLCEPCHKLTPTYAGRMNRKSYAN